VLAAAGAALGGWVGWRARARGWRMVTAGTALAALLFWVAVPNGWWAAPMPRSSRAAPR
jgi:predicted MFS family arabinose efflux permease